MANNKGLTQKLSKQEFEELVKASRDPFYFSTFIKVIHALRGQVPFLLFPFQKKVLWHFLNRRFNIILKFRQAGITELIAMYCLWLAMFHREKTIVIISIKDRVAKKVLRKIKYMYRNLPDHLKVPIVNGRGADLGTSTELEFINGSIISSIPTTEDAGRSEAVSLAVIDEAAILRWANQIWAALFPTLSTGGAAIINSTPFGTGNWFHKMWVDACDNRNSFLPIRLKWWMHPERDIHWYSEMKSALGDRRTAQEIDGDFLTSGNNVFDIASIRAIEESLEDYKPIRTEMNGQLLVFREPKNGEEFFIGSDVSTGRSRDYSAFTIMDKYGDEAAVFKGKIPVNALADVLMKYGKKYNRATVGPEGNDIGLAVVSKMQDQGYPNLYYAKRMIKKRGEKRAKEEETPGWLTTRKTRPLIIGGLEEDIRLDNVTIKYPFFVKEAYTFIYDESNRPVALGKNSRSSDADDELSDVVYSDDAIMGKCITNHIRKVKTRGIVVMPV